MVVMIIVHILLHWMMKKDFKKIIKLVFEINEKVLTLKKRIKGSI